MSQVQFADRKPLPVHASYMGEDEYVSTGLSYEDYTRCHSFTHKQSGERRLLTPRWAVNDDKFIRLITYYIENRAFSKKFRNIAGGPLEARIQVASDELRGYRAAILLNTIKRLSKEYSELNSLRCRSEHRTRRMRVLESQIQGANTSLRVNSNVLAYVVGVAVLYYRVGLDAVGVANELRVKHDHVRQTLWRLHKCWFQLTDEKPDYNDRFRGAGSVRYAVRHIPIPKARVAPEPTTATHQLLGEVHILRFRDGGAEVETTKSGTRLFCRLRDLIFQRQAC